MKYEQIPIIAVAKTGFINIFDIGNFNLIVFLSAVLAIVNAIRWHATDAQAAPLAPNAGFGTNIKFKMSFTITPTSEWYCGYH